MTEGNFSTAPSLEDEAYWNALVADYERRRRWAYDEIQGEIPTLSEWICLEIQLHDRSVPKYAVRRAKVWRTKNSRFVEPATEGDRVPPISTRLIYRYRSRSCADQASARAEALHSIPSPRGRGGRKALRKYWPD
jgi:hypothetical protein